ncbi:hypothetical protein [Pediococcus claussenii]|uniref:hypothetical protein n=1 Tax=Pediococcus claussenii TaxID=187452 RepID=UPI00081A63F4|nr:hypothetical protein [Pediococcus claussenii]ANZ70347.1 hypothetical protein AYR57_08475 [Pediococcus claussenii]ANZ72163.1 hypothetical protein AYR58_08475 [Pediococcus claussenii]
MNSREELLKHFRTEVQPIRDEFGTSAVELADTIIKIAKEKDLTYEETYAGLEYAYRFMRYQSKFLRMK